MRNFAGGAAVELVGGDTLRLRVWSPTGEQVFHDLTPAEADALREMPAIPAPEPSTPAAPAIPSSGRKKTGKET